MPFIPEFNGGISRAKSKFLTDPQYGTEVENAYIEFGYIAGIKGAEKIQKKDFQPYFYIFQDEVFSFNEPTEFVEINETLYHKRVDGELFAIHKTYNDDDETSEPVLELVETLAGIENDNSSIFNAVEVEIPEIVLTYQASNKDNFEGLPLGTYSYKICYLYQSSIIYTKSFDVVVDGTYNAVSIKLEKQKEYTAHLYRLYNGKYYLRQRIALDIDTFYQDYDENILGNVLIPNELTNEKIQMRYQYTYWNDTFETESNFTPLSDVFQVDPLKAYSLKDIIPSKDPQVTHVYVYRLGENAIKPTAVGKIENDATKETLEFIDILTNPNNTKVLDTAIYRYPCNPKIINLTSSNGILFGSIDNRIYHSSLYNPAYWADKDSFKLDDTCTALLACNEGILAFTRTKTFLITFSNGIPYQYVIANDIGCNSMGSCDSSLGMPIFSDNTGFFTYSKNTIHKMSHALLGNLENLEVIDSCTKTGVYYATTKDTTYAIDFNSGRPVISNMYTGRNFAKIQNYRNGTIYSTDGIDLFSLLTGERELFHYRSVVIHDNNIMHKSGYNTLYIIGEGKIELKILLDGNVSLSTIIDFDTTLDRSIDKTITRMPIYRQALSGEQGYGVEVIINGMNKYARVDAIKITGEISGG